MIRSCIALAALLAAASAAAAEPEVGVAAAVNPQATGTPPGEASRVIEVGLDMVRDERVVTGGEGRTQMLFVDGSALTVGPDSDVTLDEFVYDPDAGTGKLAFSASRGLFRFVGGKISKSAAVTFRTPTALIGVRGGIAIIEVGEVTRAQFLFGERMTVEAEGVVREVGRPGFQVIAAPHRAPAAPSPVSRGDVAGRLSLLEGVAGSNGGARQRPMDASVASRPIAGLGSRNPPDRMAAPMPARMGPGRGPGAGPGPAGPLPMQPPRIVSDAAQRSALSSNP
jgi:hypothetical protein